jgi:hypothetical protein
MVFSKELKEAVQIEIDKLKEEQQWIEESIAVLKGIFNESSQVVVPVAPKRKDPVGRAGVMGRAKKYDHSIFIKLHDEGLSCRQIAQKLGCHSSTIHYALKQANKAKQPGGPVLEASNPKVERQREYNRRYREKKRAALANGDNIKPYTKTSEGNNTAFKFTLEREFGLDDKDINLMRSYLQTWRATGRLEQPEILGLEHFAPIRLENLQEADRNTIRQIFYNCRSRVMDKARRLSKIQGSASIA